MNNFKSPFIWHCMSQFAPELKTNYNKPEKHSEQFHERDELN